MSITFSSDFYMFVYVSSVNSESTYFILLDLTNKTDEKKSGRSEIMGRYTTLY